MKQYFLDLCSYSPEQRTNFYREISSLAWDMSMILLMSRIYMHLCGTALNLLILFRRFLRLQYRIISLLFRASPGHRSGSFCSYRCTSLQIQLVAHILFPRTDQEEKYHKRDNTGNPAPYIVRGQQHNAGRQKYSLYDSLKQFHVPSLPPVQSAPGKRYWIPAA